MNDGKGRPSYIAKASEYQACNRAPMSAEALAQLFERQLQNGLWEGENSAEEGRLLGTARALADCADNKIDSAHPTYGARVTKAIEAVVALAVKLAMSGSAERADIGLALTTAFKVASGEALQAKVRSGLSNVHVAQRVGGLSSLN